MMSYSLGNSLLAPAPNAFGTLSREGRRLNENNNDQTMMNENNKIQEIWNKHIFQPEKIEQALSQNDIKVSSWIHDNISKPQDPLPEKLIEEPEIEEEPVSEQLESPKEEQNGSPSHHARRPMNAFLIFCKKHRPIVRDRFPNLENRGVTKILGEWWSLLEEGDKTPFTNLANEYKDAFLSANPDFKWYKLPAPPLRTLLVRPPNTIQKLPSPQTSPSHHHNNNNNNNNSTLLSSSSSVQQTFNEFTPGKLADESQLGSLTTLMNNNFSSAISKLADGYENRNESSLHVTSIVEMGENNNEIEQPCDKSLQSPVNLIKTSTVAPPKPFKKRTIPDMLFSVNDTKEMTRNILSDDCCETNEKYEYFHAEHQNKLADGLTNQDLVDKVVDNLFVDRDYGNNGMGNVLDQDKTRKSGRQCKGKRYEQFMVEGRLLGNKKDTKLTQNKPSDASKEPQPEKLNEPERKPEITTPNLENTIKRLAERTKMAVAHHPYDDDLLFPVTLPPPKPEPPEDVGCGCSETSSEPSTFNLDQKIAGLPSLSYDAFVAKKRDGKKRKLRKMSASSSTGDRAATKNDNPAKITRKDDLPVGSKKRKNKRSITHLETTTEVKSEFNDLLGLATLAEIASNTQKINERY